MVVGYITKQIINSARSHGGLVTTWDMNARGVSSDSLLHWARRHGDYVKFGHGIYEFDALNEKENINTDDQQWFMPLAQARDPQAYLAGITVLDFYNLGYVAVNFSLVRAHTTRKHIGSGETVIEPLRPTDRVDTVRGVRLQNLAQALNEARPINANYLKQAIEDAYERNLITDSDHDQLTNCPKHAVKEGAQ